MTTGSELLPWQQAQFQHLAEQHATGRLAHAYLLQGPAGLGKFTFARYFSHYLLCTAPNDQKPCQQCSGCHLFLAGNHPDLRFITPEEGKRVIRIDQVRETVDFMGKTSNQGGFKIVIIRPADVMNINAANALLKTLEEPPSGSLLLLLTDHPGLVLATVRSRSQKLAFGIPDRAVAQAWLDESLPGGSPASLLALADGAPLKALQLGEEDVQALRLQLQESLLQLLQGRLSPSEAAMQVHNAGLDATLETMMFCIHDLLRVLQSADQTVLRDAGLKELLKQLQPEQRGKQLHRLYRELLEIRQAVVTNTNPNLRLTLESMFHGWSRLVPGPN